MKPKDWWYEGGDYVEDEKGNEIIESNNSKNDSDSNEDFSDTQWDIISD